MLLETIKMKPYGFNASMAKIYKNKILNKFKLQIDAI